MLNARNRFYGIYVDGIAAGREVRYKGLYGEAFTRGPTPFRTPFMKKIALSRNYVRTLCREAWHSVT